MANVWKEPIFDRTLEDVELAIQKLEKWKKSHTHSADVRVENDALIVQDEGTAYVDNNEMVVETEGSAYVENDILNLDIDDVYDLKGCLNLADLNRIEGNISFLAEEMERNGYSPNIHGKRWTKADMPTQDDMTRIVGNIRALISAYYSPFSPPELPTTMLSITDINAIEENLYLIKQLLDCMRSSFKKVGTFKSGSTTFLPIRR